MLEYHNIKTFLQKALFQTVKRVKKVKSTAPWTYAISDLKGEEFVGTFYEKESQRKKSKIV